MYNVSESVYPPGDDVKGTKVDDGMGSRIKIGQKSTHLRRNQWLDTLLSF